MFFSLIICTHNRCKLLRNVLVQIIEQIQPFKDVGEIIIVDNGSTDNTSSVMEQFLSENKIYLYYILEKRKGKSFALNTGIGAARGEWLFFTDDDVVVRKDWINNMVKNCSENGAVSGLAGRVIPRIEGDLPKWMTLGGDLSLRGPLNNYDHGEKSFLLEPGCMPFLGANMALRRKVFERNGYFNENIKFLNGKYVVGEDSEYSYYITTRGEKIMYTPDVIVEHIFDATRLNKKYLKKWYFHIGTSTVILNGRGAERVFFRIPLWLIKETLVSLKKVILKFFKRKSPEGFYLITRFVFNLGKIRGYLLFDKYAIERLEAQRKC